MPKNLDSSIANVIEETVFIDSFIYTHSVDNTQIFSINVDNITFRIEEAIRNAIHNKIIYEKIRK